MVAVNFTLDLFASWAKEANHWWVLKVLISSCVGRTLVVGWMIIHNTCIQRRNNIDGGFLVRWRCVYCDRRVSQLKRTGPAQMWNLRRRDSFQVGSWFTGGGW